MKVWVDAQLSPAIATWLCSELHADASALRDLGMRDASDPVIFFAARVREVLLRTWSNIVALLEAGESVVEIQDTPAA